MGNNEAIYRARKAADEVLALKEDGTKQRQLWRTFLQSHIPASAALSAINSFYVAHMLKQDYRTLVTMVVEVFSKADIRNRLSTCSASLRRTPTKLFRPTMSL